MDTTEMTVGKYPAQLLLDILTDGYESWSSKFWAEAERYKWSEWTDKDDNIIVEPDTVLLRIRDYSLEGRDENNKKPPYVDITLNKLAEATDWAIDHYNHTFQGYNTNSEGIRDDVGYDAISADIIIQKMVLGDALYG